MIKKKTERTKETCTFNCETKKGGKAMSAYDNEDTEKEETVNTSDGKTVNSRGDYLSIYECVQKSAN